VGGGTAYVRYYVASATTGSVPNSSQLIHIPTRIVRASLPPIHPERRRADE